MHARMLIVVSGHHCLIHGTHTVFSQATSAFFLVVISVTGLNKGTHAYARNTIQTEAFSYNAGRTRKEF
jgi:hypothetical protein